MAKVGAMFANSIELTHMDSVWQKGGEIGHFSFGSTIVLSFEKGEIAFVTDIAAGNRVKVGEALAHVL
ncbi:phosphatidylserine decarboxylase [Planococcus lenghuensis]|nr:phosphatidylserine decarboxylase [Planococcus lenghuensis]